MGDEAEAVKKAARALLAKLPRCDRCDERGTMVMEGDYDDRGMTTYRCAGHVIEQWPTYGTPWTGQRPNEPVDWSTEAAALEALCK